MIQPAFRVPALSPRPPAFLARAIRHVFPSPKFVVVNPEYAGFLRSAGLSGPEDFLSLPEVMVSGHPDRQVSRVTVGSGPDAVRAYLKKEHYVPWKERLGNAWAGFGFASKSWREARTLRALREAGIACPDWIAAGESADGRAFLLVRELSGTVELKRFLESLRAASLPEKRTFARKLGAVLARIHNAGFDHADLYANHILVDPHAFQIHVVDWQRSAYRGTVSWKRRIRDLAALTATLPLALAGPRERLACLAAYLRECDARTLSLRSAIAAVRRIECRLLRRRHVRAKRLPPARQSLTCLDGNALCVTPAFLRLWPDRPPDFLTAPLASDIEAVVTLPDGTQGLLVRRRYRLSWLARWLPRRRPWTSPERKQMSLLFRLQRHGLEVPQVLAVGERSSGRGSVEALLLTRLPSDVQPFARRVEDRAAVPATGEECHRRRMLLRELGAFLARLHHAGCFFGTDLSGIALREPAGAAPSFALIHAAGLTIRRRCPLLWRRRDLARLRRELSAAGWGRG